MLVDSETRATETADGISTVFECTLPTDLYGELQSTAQVFNRLARRLEENILIKNSTVDIGVQTEGCCEEIKKKLRECLAENIRLKQSLKDVSDINLRWQNYNANRQKYVRHLKSSLSELRRFTFPQNTNTTMNTSSPPYDTYECPTSPMAIDDRSIFAVPKTPAFYDDLLSENQRLTQSLNDTRRMLIAFERQLEECKEDHEILKIQLKSYKEEWEVEREEKNVALCEIRRMKDLKTCQEYTQRLGKNNGSCDKYGTIHKVPPFEYDELTGRKRRSKSRQVKPSSIVCHVDGLQIRLQERNSREQEVIEETIYSEKSGSQKNTTSNDPIVTFPETNSNGSIHSSLIQEELNLQPSSFQLLCSSCSHRFENQSKSQLPDHYTQCKSTFKKTNS